jgi:hypothetical protein
MRKRIYFICGDVVVVSLGRWKKDVVFNPPMKCLMKVGFMRVIFMTQLIY